MNWLVCIFTGHNPGWILSRVQNPYADRSLTWGCERCGRALYRDDPRDKIGTVRRSI